MNEQLAKLMYELDEIRAVALRGREKVMIAKAMRLEGMHEQAKEQLRAASEACEQLSRMRRAIENETVDAVAQVEVEELDEAILAEIEAATSPEFDCDACHAAWCDDCAKADSLADTVPVSYG